MKESMGPQRRPGPIQALLRTRVTGGEAGPSEPKAPLPSVQRGDAHTSRSHLPTTVDRVRGGTSEAVISLMTMINSAVKSH